jgi:DNA-binding Lrp family transcriptional regulator
MGTKAFILIEADIGKLKYIVQTLAELKGVKSVDLVTGSYDAIAVVEGADPNAVGQLVTDGIHPIPGIIRTVTCFALDFQY